MRNPFKVFILSLSLICAPLTAAQAESWSVFVYMCGSDVESAYGHATADIDEMFEARPSDDVTVVLQTGGAKQWHNPDIPASRMTRFVIKNGQGTVVDAGDGQVNMGDAQTLCDFLVFCQDNYAADHEVLIIWDHGGGTVGGFALDENFDGDAIFLSELREALAAAYGGAEGKPLDIIGFDACLMATVDVAFSVAPYADYMVASQELEPGNGWHYTRWLDALADNTHQSAASLAKTMCDAYLSGCEEAGSDYEATLSMIDLEKTSRLMESWSMFGMYALMQAAVDDTFYADIGRAAVHSENFFNSRITGFSNMVDMGDFIANVSAAFAARPPVTDSLLEDLEDAVVYRVGGPSHHEVSGLSCYYPFDADADGFRRMLENGIVTPFILTFGLQYGFIDSESAGIILNSLSGDSDGLLPDTWKVRNPQKLREDAADAVPRNVKSGVRALLSQKPLQGQDPVDFAVEMFKSNLALFSRCLQPMGMLDVRALEGHALRLITGEDGSPGLEIDIAEDVLKYVDTVRYGLGIAGEDGSLEILGNDADLRGEWETGVFRDNFRGIWPGLDGHLVSLENTAAEADHNDYVVPVIFNGVRSFIEVRYTFDDDAYEVLGVRRILGNGYPDKNLYTLKAGDVITLLRYRTDADGAVGEYEGESFELGDDWKFADVDLPDGTYAYAFAISDIQNNEAASEFAYITIAGDDTTFRIGN